MDRITLARITGAAAPTRPPESRSNPPPLRSTEFADALRKELPEPVRFSAHATARLRSRGIQLTDRDQQALEQAVDAAAAKGARDAVLLQEDRAFVVNIPNRVVVTAHTSAEARAHVYTGIDAAVMI